MKTILNLNTILIICSFWTSSQLIGQIIEKKNVLQKSKSTMTDIGEAITICKWKYDAQTCLNFSFDDNNISHKKISDIFDQYNFKATFFVIASYMYAETMKEMHINGHEIGNHTYSHINLTSPIIDSTEIDFQIRQSKSMIENTLGIKCLSFTEPYHSYSQQSKSIVLHNHLFDRDYSQYFVRDFYGMNPLSTLDDEKTFIENKIKDKKIILFAGHGVDGDGSEPVSSDFLHQTLDLVNEHVLNGDLWVTTLKEGVQYENLFQETQLEKSIIGDTIKLLFKKFNRNKYRDCDKAPISISIPKIMDSETSCLTNLAETTEFPNKFVITTDLMRDTTLIVLIKPLGVVTAENEPLIETKYSISPNPAMEYINLDGVENISLIEIYNMNGQLQFKQTVNNSKVDISKLSKGCYLTKVKHQVRNIERTSYARLIKI
jgi:hypothetical protein